VLRTIIFFSVFFFSFYSATAQEKPWKLKAEKEGITIYNRSVNYSRVKQLKMTTSVKSTLGALVNVLDDVSRYPEWMYGCKGGERVNPNSSDRPYYMTTIQFPKPMSWRVMFINDDNFVVMEEVETIWKLKPLENGEVQIESYLFCDPAGNIPFWLVNTLLDRGPMKTIQRLKKRLQQEEFRNVKFEGIKD